MSSTTGSWQPVPPRYSYAWYERASSAGSWQLISGASGSKYTVGAYSGDQVSVAVTASNDGGSSTAMAKPMTVTGGTTSAILPPAVARACEHGGAACFRYGCGRGCAVDLERVLVQQPDELCVPVGGLQQLRWIVLGHQWRDVIELHRRFER